MKRKSEKFAANAEAAWPILVKKAASKQTMTYGELGKQLYGNKTTWNLGTILGHIAEYCKANGLPQLNVLVVKKQTQRPGDRIPLDPKDFDQTTERVFQLNWSLILVPTAAMLA